MDIIYNIEFAHIYLFIALVRDLIKIYIKQPSVLKIILEQCAIFSGNN